MNLGLTVRAALIQSGASIEFAALMALIDVETGGRGFDPATGKIMIQFEPVWFKRREPYAPSGLWSINKVDVQKREWLAFNEAFGIDPESAMESTSIGLPQIMGGHWKRLGYASVGAMWDDFKQGELNQVRGLIKFIESDPVIHEALLNKNWTTVAIKYNGKQFREIAKKYGREPYDLSMAKAYARYK